MSVQGYSSAGPDICTQSIGIVCPHELPADAA